MSEDKPDLRAPEREWRCPVSRLWTAETQCELRLHHRGRHSHYEPGGTEWQWPRGDALDEEDRNDDS